MATKKKTTRKPAARRAASPRRERSAVSALKKSARKIAFKKSTARNELIDARVLKAYRLPRIGERTKDGEFMGIGRGADGQPDYKLFRGPYAPKRLNHAAALDFAALCRQGGHKDWDLADQTDGWLLQANGRGQARSGWHWLKPQYAHIDASAWAQYFGDGYQGLNLKSDELEVVLVRRLPIR